MPGEDRPDVVVGLHDMRYPSTTRLARGELLAPASHQDGQQPEIFSIASLSLLSQLPASGNLPQSAIGERRCWHYSLGVADDSFNSNLPIQLQGQLLLADPSLRSGAFHRSVVLLAEHHSDEGAFGLILNHPTGKVVGDLLHGEDFAPLRQLAVYEGGPVAPDQLTFSSLWWSKKLGLRWALRISAEQAVIHSQRPGRIVRAFVGYSGWSPGQLENELRCSSWIATRPKPDLLGHAHDRSLWSDLLRNLSPLHRILAEAPNDPSLN